MQWKYKALRLAALAFVAMSGAAMGQNPPADQSQPPAEVPVTAPPSSTAATEEVTPRKSAQEEIVVTGSRVRRKDLTTPAPVTVISRDQITASGVASIGEFLQQMPEQGGALNTQVNNGGDGTTQINLRDLGAFRTLVLVDGKRMVNGGVGPGDSVDLNTIPTAAVERVEVLKDGGSAVYGSDAIAGVVNIITRKRMDGVEFNAYTGTSTHNDAKVYDFNVLAGATGDRGSFMFGAGYFDQKSYFASARDWATNALSYDFLTGTKGLSGSGTLPRVRVNALDPASCNGKTSTCSNLFNTFGAGKKNFIFDPTHVKAGATYSPDGWRVRDSAVDFYNYQAVNYLVTPSQRISLFGNGEFRLADFARSYFQTSYVQRQSNYLVAPEPFVTTGNPNLVVKAGNPYNPFGVDLTSVQRRLTDISGRGGAFDVNTFRVVTGVDGTVGDIAGPLTGWFWDTFVNYGRTAGTFTNSGFLNTQKTGPGIGPGFPGPGGTFQCGTTTAPIANCTPINLFGPPNSITPDMATQLGAYTGTNQGLVQLFMVGANTSGELFKIASDRPAALALGYEFRSEYGNFINQPILAAGWDSDTGSPGPSDTRGGYHVNEGFAELVVPVISHVPLAEDIELQGAARVFHYSTFGSDWTYKFGGRWSPIRDVTFRGTYSTAFRAPNIAELFTGQTGGNFESSNDPCASSPPPAPPGQPPNLGNRCRDAPGSAGGPNVPANGITVAQINSVTGGNQSLQPEKAKIGTVGVVFEPQMVRGLTLTGDFYTISMNQLISAYGTQLILNKCYGVGVTQDTSFCANVTRDGPTGAVNRVVDINQNVGALLTNGFDLGAQYSLPTDFGRFLFRFNGTYMLKYDYTDPTGIVIHGAGNYDGQGQVQASGSTNFNPKVKFNVGAQYSLVGFTFGAIGHYIGPLTECAPEGGLVAGANTGPGFCYQNLGFPSHSVSAQFTVDLLASYRLVSPAGTTTLALGVRNVGDQAPPRLYDSFLTYADPAYDFVGRYFYGRVEHRF